jgi:hypothetical protein
MKYVKMLGLAAVAAAALMAFVGASTASATVLCSTTTTPCNSKWANGTNFSFSLESGSSLVWKETGSAGEVLDTCKGVTLTAGITNAGSSAETVRAQNKTLDWSECAWATTTTLLGGLEIHNISGTSNGTLTSSEEIRWTISMPFFGSCVYGWKLGKDIGTITEGNPATLDVNAIIEKLTGSSITCPETASLFGNFVQTEPASTTLAVEPS